MIAANSEATLAVPTATGIDGVAMAIQRIDAENPTATGLCGAKRGNGYPGYPYLRKGEIGQMPFWDFIQICAWRGK